MNVKIIVVTISTLTDAKEYAVMLSITAWQNFDALQIKLTVNKMITYCTFNTIEIYKCS